MTEKEHLIQLLTSGKEENISLGLQLETGTGIDLSDFWEAIEATFKVWDEAPSHLRDKPNRNRADWKHLLLKDKIFLNDYSGTNNPMIQQLPEGVTHLRHINLLILRLPYLKTLPSSIRRLEQLTAFWLMNMKSFETLPPEIGQLHKLENLSFIRGRINTLPIEICQLKNLKTLGLDDIDYLPPFIQEMQHLTSLSLCSEKTDGAFLPYIYKLKRLKRFRANNCNLTHLDDAIINIKYLSSLHLDNNKLTKLPDALIQLKRLNEIHIKHNPIAPKEVERWRTLLPNCNIIAD